MLIEFDSAAIARVAYLARLESLARIFRVQCERAELEPPVLVLALRIFPSKVLAGIKAEGLPSAIPGMARRWQMLCKASERRLSAPFVPLSAGNE